ncbi:MAG: hypothetical protein ACK5GN_10900 [Pseudomonadota bacterium]|jgi:hypothetical protein
MERDTILTPPATDRSSRECGAAVFLALFALAAISYSCMRLIMHTASYAHLVRTYRDGIEHLSSLRESVRPVNSHLRSCERQYLHGKNIAGTPALSLYRQVCTNGRPPFMSNQGVWPLTNGPDYAPIFAIAVSCQGTRTASTRNSFDSPSAPFNCLLPETLADGVILVDNIIFSQSTIGSAHNEVRDPRQITILATPGSLIANVSLSLPGNALIITGGDIKIPTLRLHSSAAAEVTIISAHGDIVIERIDGALALLALGRRVLSTPPSARPVTPPLPDIRQSSVAGIAADG